MRTVTMLGLYHEVVGRFIRLEERDGALFVEIGKHIVVLPLELKESLSPHLGNRVAILRTDILNKQYLVRVLEEPRTDIGQAVRTQDDSMQISEEV